MTNIGSWEELMALNRACGGLVTVSEAARAAGVCRTRMDVLVQDGRFPTYGFNGVLYVSLGAVLTWARKEHRVGRPKTVCNVATVSERL